MGFIIILQAVILIVLLVKRSSGTESGENTAQLNTEYEEVGLATTSSKNQGVTQDVPVQSAEYEEVSLAPSKNQGAIGGALVPSMEYEEVGLTTTSSENQGATRDAPVQSAEYETTSPQATSDDHVYEKVTKQMEQACYENTSTASNKF